MQKNASDKTYFLFYSLLYLLCHVFIGCFGPIIPYFALKTGKPETQFSFIFIVSSLACVCGGLLAKTLFHRFSYHNILIGSILGAGLSYICSWLSLTIFWLSLTLFLGGACSAIVLILTSLCVIEVFQQKGLNFWLQFLFLFIGPGLILGSVLVILTKDKALLFGGILISILIIPFCILNSPEQFGSVSGKIEADEEFQIQHIQSPLQLSFRDKACLFFLVMIYASIREIFAGWIPTYGVQLQFANPAQGGVIVLIYFLISSLFRIVSMFSTATLRTQLNFEIRGLFISTLILFILQALGEYKLTAYLGAVLLGACTSSIFANLFVVIPQYGFQLTPDTIANLDIAFQVGSGIALTPIGYLIGQLGPQVLIYSTVLSSLVLLVLFEVLFWIWEKEASQRDE